MKADPTALTKEKSTISVKDFTAKSVVKRISNAPAGPVSAETDELDEIYKE